MKLRTINRLFRDLTEEQRATVQRCLAHMPDEPVDETSNLWKLYEAGELGMFALVSSPDQIEAAVFFKVLETPGGAKDFCLFGACSVNTVNAINEALPAVESAARKLGCDSASLRTCRPGMVAKMQSLGWFPAEIIVRKNLQ